MSHLKTWTPVTWLENHMKMYCRCYGYTSRWKNGTVGTCTTGTNLASSILRNLYAETFYIYSHIYIYTVYIIINFKSKKSTTLAQQSSPTSTLTPTFWAPSGCGWSGHGGSRHTKAAVGVVRFQVLFLKLVKIPETPNTTAWFACVASWT